MAKKKSVKIKEKSADKSAIQLNELLVQNFVSLQHIMTDMAGRFDRLSDNISRLLQLFETSAKTFAEKQQQAPINPEKDKEFLNKLNALLEQNKTLAKGLTLIEAKINEKAYSQERELPLMPPQGMQPSPAPPLQSEEKPERFKKLPRF